MKKSQAAVYDAGSTKRNPGRPRRTWLAGEESGIQAALLKAYLYGVDLHGAKLSKADLPLKCGGLHWRIDNRIARQLFYHLCSMECNDPEFIVLRNSGLDFANQRSMTIPIDGAFLTTAYLMDRLLEGNLIGKQDYQVVLRTLAQLSSVPKSGVLFTWNVQDDN
jgi:uncharacterized protein YjbI with pentapeptide repeats